MVRPFYRWKSLWLGLLVLVFLGWGWARSVHRYDVISWGETTGGRGVSLGQRDSLVLVSWNATKSAAGFIPGVRPFGVIMEPRNHPLLPAVFHPSAVSRSPGVLPTASVPHWLLILLFLIPWLAFLVWRSRQMKRLAGLLPAAHD